MTNNFSMISRIIVSILFISLKFIVISSDVLVTGRCGRPSLPPKAHLRQISPERSRFDNNERVFIICEENQFPHHRQQRICKNGRWTGDRARCGKSLSAQVIKFEIEDCESSVNKRLLSQSINQSIESEYPLPPNSFHSTRINPNMTISGNESTCYLWKIKFDQTVQITYILIDIFFPSHNMTKELPNLIPFVSKYRNCELQKADPQTVGDTQVVGYYYFCDLKSEEDRKKELIQLSDTISVRINTSVKLEIGLEAVFIGDIYTTKSGANKMSRPDCGDLEIQNAGVMIQKELLYTNIRCNDSFVDHWKNPDNRYKFNCDLNGQWVGEWPVCVPIVTCPKDEIIYDRHYSVMIEEIGNVYYLTNSSDWFAINETWVRYSCLKDNDIMVGKSVRTCKKDGKWSNKSPYCTGASDGLSGFGISGILFAVLVVFVLIVFLVFRFHSKRVNRELTQTRNEIEETSRKRISDEYYADVRDSTCYEDNSDFGRKSMMYETVNYEETDDMPRYQIAPNRSPGVGPEYLDMLAMK